MQIQIPLDSRVEGPVVASGYGNSPMDLQFENKWTKKTIWRQEKNIINEWEEFSLPPLNKTSSWLPRIYPYTFFGNSGNKLSVQKKSIIRTIFLLIGIMYELCS